MLVSQQLNGLYFASLYRNCIQFLPVETLVPQLEYRSFIKDAVQRTQKCRVLIKVLTPESRIFVAGENHVKIAVLVVATVDQVKEQPRILFIPEDVKVVTMIPVGYHDGTQERKPRKSLEEITSYNRY